MGAKLKWKNEKYRLNVEIIEEKEFPF